MNQREYLQTLSDEERIKVRGKLLDEWEQVIEYEQSVNNRITWVLENLLDWYESPHSTTADEDFLEMGFVLADESKQHFTYWGTANFDKFRYTVYNDTSNLTCMPSNYGQVIAYSYMEKLEKIAEKKRREMGCGE